MRRPTDGVGLLLAAGLSRRFGPTDKLLAPWRGEPLVTHAARALADTGCRRLIAVTSSPYVATLLAPLGFGIVANARPEDGLGGSLALAANALGGEPWALLALGDMPDVPATHLLSLLRGEGPVAASSAAGIAMPPARFDATMFAALRRATGDRGARPLLAQARLFPLPAAVLRDIDRQEDLDA